MFYFWWKALLLAESGIKVGKNEGHLLEMRRIKFLAESCTLAETFIDSVNFFGLAETFSIDKNFKF